MFRKKGLHTKREAFWEGDGESITDTKDVGGPRGGKGGGGFPELGRGKEECPSKGYIQGGRNSYQRRFYPKRNNRKKIENIQDRGRHKPEELKRSGGHATPTSS